MGLKTTNYEAKKFGITLPTAYARLTDISININGMAFGNFEVHQNREDISQTEPFEKVNIYCAINKDLPIYSQLYIKAKEEYFSDWEDDIIAEIEVE